MKIKKKKQYSKIPNLKAPGHDGVQGFWIKRLDKMHERIATQLNEILEWTKEISSWMKYRRTVLCQKDPAKGNSVENFRPITCLLLICRNYLKVLFQRICTVSRKTKTYFQRSKKGCRRKSRGLKN